jgi:signal transduction histidine kinase
MFRQIVLNLLSNALKFTDKGEVDVMLSEDDGDFVLEVRDTGVGIDPQYHQLIFEKFYRVRQPEGSSARQGSGLGLAIVKGLVEAHGGRVTVESVLGKGSTFRVVLPKQPRRF